MVGFSPSVVAAVFGYVNHRFLRLPTISGTLLVALVSSLIVVLIDPVVPGIDLRFAIEGFLGEIDFDQTLMHGLLCFLRFAGALHVDFEGLIQQGWLTAGLATVGVLLAIAKRRPCGSSYPRELLSREKCGRG